MRFGFVGPSYSTTAAISHEECINFFAESNEATGAVASSREFGGQSASSPRSYIGTPGLATYATLTESPVRGLCWTGSRLFAVGGSKLVEYNSSAVPTARATLPNDSLPVSFAVSNTQLLIVTAGRAYCYTLADDSIKEVTSLLAGVPVKARCIDTYFIVCFANSNKFQMSGILDGLTWPGLQVNAVSVFPDNIVSIEAVHSELWVFGSLHSQVYQDTGSDEVFDVMKDQLIENGCAATFSPCVLDNTVFWINQDERGARVAWRAQGYTPQRISTHAVENDLSTYASIAGMTSYSYQDGGHLFWVLYVPGSQWSWVYDVGEGMWHKRQSGLQPNGTAHWSQNHVYAFGKNLVGDWNTGNIYEMSLKYYDDNGTSIRRVRQAPTIIDEMKFIPIADMTVDLQTGQTSSLVDGDGFPRAPQASLQWSDNRGQTWGNEHFRGCGMAGEYNVRVIWRRQGRTRYRVYRFVVSDPIQWIICDAYLRPANG